MGKGSLSKKMCIVSYCIVRNGKIFIIYTYLLTGCLAHEGSLLLSSEIFEADSTKFKKSRSLGGIAISLKISIRYCMIKEISTLYNIVKTLKVTIPSHTMCTFQVRKANPFIPAVAQNGLTVFVVPVM